MNRKLEIKLPPADTPEQTVEQAGLWRPKYEDLAAVLLEHCTQVQLLELKRWSQELGEGDCYLSATHKFISPKQEVEIAEERADFTYEGTSSSLYETFKAWGGYDLKEAAGHMHFQYSEDNGIYIMATNISPQKNKYPAEVEEAIENLRREGVSLRQ